MATAGQLGLVLGSLRLPIGCDDAHPAENQSYQCRREEAEVAHQLGDGDPPFHVTAQKWMARP
ncbi:MAG: hypothetical protein ACREJ0_28275 [Geminicoccaceae bacterium]